MIDRILFSFNALKSNQILTIFHQNMCVQLKLNGLWMIFKRVQGKNNIYGVSVV